MVQRYFVLFFIIFSFTYCKSQEAFIPMPTEIKWNQGRLDLLRGIKFELDDSIKANERDLAESIFLKRDVVEKSGVDIPVLSMRIDPNYTAVQSDEGYSLLVNQRGIHILAKGSRGIFYALQTLDQFSFEDNKLGFVELIDEPAYSFRGFLIDVGRNYQPVSMIKEQIDMMARYKLNVLHFHFTEDIAWRLESKKHAGLTASKNMTRWAGQYYSVNEFRELIDYCKERHILFLPEIDMPGHSAAFERYFGVNMQTKEGIVYIKELLKEFSETFPELTDLHIGGDEVKITNKDFMPEITKYVESLGFKTYGWEPGSNLERTTVRQLWMGGPKALEKNAGLRYIDSKHLYINHMDPLETVTTLFFRKFAEQDRGDEGLIGAILCAWPDRAVEKPRDMFYQNSVYPGMIAFSERIWRGTGESKWRANLPERTNHLFQAFKEFEDRLMLHKVKYFTNLPFPYQRQTEMVWDLIGPFDNSGDLSKSFSIEKAAFVETERLYKQVVGGTVILRHWWNDVISGAIKEPKENSTFYARAKIWSEHSGIKPFWVGFGNLSRSYASDTPALGKWDELSSKVFINGEEVMPPSWINAGHKGSLEVPLVDEGYSFREPTMIQLRQGWNEVLIKLPVGSFKGKDWQNPIKWMFTFIPYQ